MLIYGSTPSGGVILKYTAADGSLQVVTGSNGAEVQKAKAANDARLAANTSSTTASSSSSVVSAKKQTVVNAVKSAALTSKSKLTSNVTSNHTAVRGTGSTVSDTYYDIDSALASIKAQAAAYGVSLTIPASYGKSIKSASVAQGIVDSYVSKANELIAAKYTTTSQASQPSQSSQSSKAATAAKNVTASAAAKTASYYDVDSALASVYKQAVAAGLSVSKPKIYGSTITDSKKAQSIIDSYTTEVNKKLSSNASSSAKTTSSSGGSVSTKVATATTTTTYDISSSVKSLSATAKAYGVSATAPKTTTYKTQKEAQSAIDSYSTAIEKAYTATVKAQSVKAASAAAANTTTSNYYSGSLNSQEQQTLNKWNAREASNNTGKHYNPAYIKWYYEAPANTQSPPVYLEDAAKESASVTAARNAANAKAEGQIADIQKELAQSSALESKGVVSHVANNINNPSNTKSSNYSKGVATSGSVAASKTAPAKIISTATAKLATKLTATTQAVKAVAPKVISAQAKKLQAGTCSTAKATSENLNKLAKQVTSNHASVIKESSPLIRTADIE